MPLSDRIPPPHTLTADAVAAQLESRVDGLSSAAAATRLLAHGPNELRPAHRTAPWQLLLAQFRNVLVLVLLVATGLSALLGHGVEAVVITVIVVFSVLLGFIQEFRAERALESLQQMAAPSATVLRDGQEVMVPARDVVPGDVLLLSAGNRVAADARLLAVANLRTQEAVLTGESLPIDKHVEPIADPEAPTGDRRNMVYAGTLVSYGRGRALVVATGMGTEFGRVAELLTTVDAGRTPLQLQLDRLGRTLAQAALVVVAVVVLLGLVRGQPLLDMLVFGIALAVAVVPEALPAVVTISLALGVQRMVRRKALMRRLPAVETLGSTSVIGSDKTGTLTRDEMTVRRILVAGQMLDVTGAGYEPVGSFVAADGRPVAASAPLQRLLRAAVLACDARLLRRGAAWTIQGDPTEGALVVAAEKAGLRKAELDAAAPRVHELPFSSERRCMTTLHRTSDGIVAFTKGAPEVVVAACVTQVSASGDVPLTEADRGQILAAAQAMAGSALRVLAVAGRRDADPEHAERDLVFLGLLGMIDPPRPEAQTAIATCRAAGIRVVMITGDHPVTAAAVARELGLLAHGRVASGAELDRMDDAALATAARDIAVYARVSPAHKLRVVTALQQGGQVVAMTGDGVNDAPALKKADIGIAMGVTGTDVAREAAAMTLTDDNFASIVAAVEEGRAIFGNIKKYLMFLLSSNIGEIGLVAGTAVLGLPLPLTAVQMLYVNLATDGLPALALAVDPADPDLMREPPRDPRRGVFSRPVVALMLVGGLWSTAVNLGLFAWARSSGRGDQEAMTMTFVALVLIQFCNAFAFRSDHRSVLERPFANRWLNAAIAWEVLLLLVVVYVPALHGPFGTFSLTGVDWLVVVAAAASVLPVLELARWVVRRVWPSGTGT